MPFYVVRVNPQSNVMSVQNATPHATMDAAIKAIERDPPRPTKNALAIVELSTFIEITVNIKKVET